MRFSHARHQTPGMTSSAFAHPAKSTRHPDVFLVSPALPVPNRRGSIRIQVDNISSSKIMKKLQANAALFYLSNIFFRPGLENNSFRVIVVATKEIRDKGDGYATNN
jgi:hypothetical protein